jgi:hypothetical protein
MNCPSRNALNRRCNLYPLGTGQDPDAGTLGDAAAATATGVPCAANPGPVQYLEADGRVTAVRHWTFLFGSDPGATTLGRVDLLGADGVTVTNRVRALGPASDNAGRLKAWRVEGEERL